MPQVKQLVTKNEFNRFPNAAALDVPVASFLGGGSFSSHVTEKWRKGASARHFPSLWHSHSWLCASLRTWRPPRLRPSRRKPHPSFTVPDGFAGRIGRLAQRDRFLSAVYAWRLFRLRLSRRKPHPSFAHFAPRMVLRDEAVGLRREAASSPRFMRRNLSSLRTLRRFLFSTALRTAGNSL